MSYDVDELFIFKKYGDGYAIDDYFDYPDITEVEIPAEYKATPVTAIADYAFFGSHYLRRIVIPPSVREIDVAAFRSCELLENVEFSEGLEFIAMEVFVETGLKSVRLPKSLKELGETAFCGCPELERVEFNSEPEIGFDNFRGCPKLPPETVVMGLVCSTDITRPISPGDLELMVRTPPRPCEIYRRDIFDLLVKNDCFRECCPETVVVGIIRNNKPELFPVAEHYGMLDSAELVDELIDLSAGNQTTEITAYLLDLKRRKFGFNGGGDFEL